MNILHCSDFHGRLQPLRDEFDVIVASGDMLPNYMPGWPEAEAQWQRDWVIANRDKLRKWAKDKPLLWIPGNHCFADVTPQLCEVGIDAHSLSDQQYTFNHISFYGFPWVPEYGHWSYGANDATLRARTYAMDLAGVDILVCHAPPYGVLDRSGGHGLLTNRIGNKHLTSLFDTAPPPSVRTILCGHCHECGGGVATPWPGVTVYNNACTQRIIEV